LREELVVEDDPIPSGDRTTRYVPPVEGITQELDLQAATEYVDHLSNVIEAPTI
jgi:hypothetical protein